MNWQKILDIASRVLSQQILDIASRVLSQDLRKIPNLYYLTSKAFERCTKTDAAEREVFLDKVLDFMYPTNSPQCERHGLTRALLLDLVAPEVTESSLPRLPSPQHISIPNGLVIELKKFQDEHHLTWGALLSWLQYVRPGLYVDPSKQLPGLYAKMHKKYKKVGHAKERAKKPEDYRSFMEADFLPPPKQPSG